MSINIIRDKYLEKVKPFIGKNIIKVLTGQRRVGKTTILLQIVNMIKNMGSDANIIYINKESNDFNHIKSSEELFAYVKSQLSESKNNYVFIDEIQEIKDFEIALRQLLVEGTDIYCTGSNAKLLSGDLATYLSGRYITIHINSLSYTEFLEFHHLQNNNESLNKYMNFGGLPYLMHLPLNDEIVFTYLKDIFNTIILKDVVSRYNIRDVDFLERLTEYLSDNLGNYLSSKKISEFLKSQRVSLSINTVLNYLKYLTDSFFINKLQRYDIIGKKRFEINDKYYFSDLGLKNCLIPYSGNHLNGIFENLVYNQLVNEDYTVFVGKLQDREIDFVAQKGNETLYIQVAYLISDEKVREREFGNLLKINDNFEKIVVSADEFRQEYKGIKHYHIRDFLSRSYHK